MQSFELSITGKLVSMKCSKVQNLISQNSESEYDNYTEKINYLTAVSGYG